MHKNVGGGNPPSGSTRVNEQTRIDVNILFHYKPFTRWQDILSQKPASVSGEHAYCIARHFVRMEVQVTYSLKYNF